MTKMQSEWEYMCGAHGSNDKRGNWSIREYRSKSDPGKRKVVKGYFDYDWNGKTKTRYYTKKT